MAGSGVPAQAQALTCARTALVHVRGAPARPVPGPEPRRPEDHREDSADETDDEQNPADGVDVDPGEIPVHRPDQDCSGGGEKHADSESHEHLPSSAALYPDARSVNVSRPSSRGTNRTWFALSANGSTVKLRGAASRRSTPSWRR